MDQQQQSIYSDNTVDNSTAQVSNQQLPQQQQLQQNQQQQIINNSEQTPPHPETSMTKLTEVFMTAALAFQRLGELTQHIHVVGETKWTENDATKLTNALEKFQEECAEVTKNLQTRTGKMIRTDFKRRTINQYHQQQGNTAAGIAMQHQQQQSPSIALANPSPSYVSTVAASPSHHYNNGGAIGTPSTSSQQPIQGYTYQTQRIIPAYPIHQKVGLPSTSYTVGQKRPAQPLTGIPVKRVVGNTTFRPVSSASLISQPTSSNVYRQKQ